MRLQPRTELREAGEGSLHPPVEGGIAGGKVRRADGWRFVCGCDCEPRRLAFGTQALDFAALLRGALRERGDLDSLQTGEVRTPSAATRHE